MDARWTWRLVVPRLIGALLLVAAGLKIYGLGGDPVARMGVFSMPEFQLGVVIFEVSLGVWLLSGKLPLASWLVAIGTFAIFSSVSLYLALIGQTTCGCFGSAVKVSPWAAFTLDIVVVSTLLLGRPDFRSLRHNPWQSIRTGIAPLAWTTGSVILSGAVIIGLAHLGFGSVRGAIAYYRGDRLSVEPRLVDMGEVPGGQKRTVTVTLTNWTEESIHVFGGSADCSCTVLGDLPVLIPPHESRSVTVELQVKLKPGIFTRKAAFVLDDHGFKKIEFHITGHVTEAATAGP